MNTIKIMSDIEAMNDELITLRRIIHQNPEIGFEIDKTFAFVKSTLESYGYVVEKVGINGISTTVGNGNGKVILLRADMDALPILEDTGLEFSSQNIGKMHACGHDIHTTMLLGAAKIFKKYENEINGTVKLMFQPAEETLQGAKDMIDHGILTNPKPDAAAMIHVASGMPISVGSVVLFENGPIMAASDTLYITIKGKGGHGSSPYLGIDPLPCASAILNALQTIQTRELPPGSLNALTFGLIDGAYTANVIADSITIAGTLRSYDASERTFIKERIETIVNHISLAYRCEGFVRTMSSCPVFLNDGSLTSTIHSSLEGIIDKELLVAPMKLPIPIMGSEDFAYLSQELPTSLIYLGAGDSRNGKVHGVHSPNVIFNENCILNGVRAHVFSALGYLSK